MTTDPADSSRTTQYFADPFEAPASRARLANRIDPSVHQ
jgi:hypothetical protein